VVSILYYSTTLLLYYSTTLLLYYSSQEAHTH